MAAYRADPSVPAPLTVARITKRMSAVECDRLGAVGGVTEGQAETGQEKRRLSLVLRLRRVCRSPNSFF